MKKYLLILISLLITVSLSSQSNKNLAEMLGYPKDSKLLIIHADDMGLSHSENAATIMAFENKGITSGSIMLPCPWSLEIIDYVKDHPGLDVGVHLTMTAEWDQYKWGGISSSDQISSLLDPKGYFYATVEELGKAAKAPEAEKELKAQIDRLISYGIQPTHIDTHMGSVLANGELVKIYLGLSEEYHLPVLFPRIYLAMLPPDVSKSNGLKNFPADNLFMPYCQMISGKWIDAYKKGIESLKPGLNQMIVHIALDNDEMRAITKGHPDLRSEWRQEDLNLVCSKEFKDFRRKPIKLF